MRCTRVDRLRLRRGDLDDERVEVLRLVGAVAAERLEEDRAEREDVRPAVEMRLAARLLRAHVERRAEDGTGDRERVVRVVLEELADAEVEHLRDRDAVLHLVEVDVRRLEIAMDDAGLVRCRERIADLDHHDRELVEGHRRRLPAEGDLEREAREQLHHEEELALLRLTDVVDVDDVRVVHARGDLRLLQEASRRLGRLRDLRVHELDGDLALGERVRRRPDLGHPPASEGLVQPVFACDDVSPLHLDPSSNDRAITRSSYLRRSQWPVQSSNWRNPTRGRGRSRRSRRAVRSVSSESF